MSEVRNILIDKKLWLLFKVHTRTLMAEELFHSESDVKEWIKEDEEYQRQIRSGARDNIKYVPYQLPSLTGECCWF